MARADLAGWRASDRCIEHITFLQSVRNVNFVVVVVASQK